MPLTKLDNTAALIVIDLQKGIASLPTVHPMGEIIARSAPVSYTHLDVYKRQTAPSSHKDQTQ